jgi:hypothetical protein
MADSPWFTLRFTKVCVQYVTFVFVTGELIGQQTRAVRCVPRNEYFSSRTQNRAINHYRYLPIVIEQILLLYANRIYFSVMSKITNSMIQ